MQLQAGLNGVSCSIGFCACQLCCHRTWGSRQHVVAHRATTVQARGQACSFRMWPGLTRSGRFAKVGGMGPLRLLSLTFSQLQHKRCCSLQEPLCLTGRHAAQQMQDSCGGNAGGGKHPFRDH